MTPKSQVNALSVLDWWIDMYATPAGESQSNKELRQARAAVAELIEADREYDEANSDWEEVTSRDPAETDDETWRLVSDRFEAAVMRRMNALDRIGGAK